MRKTRILAAFLTLLMIIGAFPTVLITPVFAAEATSKDEKETIDYLTKIYKTPEEKLETMELKLSQYGYELYVENYTGEVAVRDTKSGQILFTNPIDIPDTFKSANDGSTTSSSADIKKQLLSQLIVKYTDNDKEVNMMSFTEASERGQIKIKNVKNGIRVEYTMGRQETRKLVPRLIEKGRMEELILDYITDEAKYKKVTAFYTLKDPSDPTLTERAIKELNATFPITTKMSVYVFDPYAADRELNLIEQIIKTYCPHYTYETLQEDHTITEYEGNENDPALFKMALEYYLDEDGMYVRLPANGITYNESKYSLTSIQVLPYMGAGNSDYTGYTFYPDGAGTLVRFEDLTSQRTITGQLYGMDFAYHTLTATQMETLRMPVYGVVENHTNTTTTEIEEEIEGYYDAYGDYIEPTVKVTTLKEETTESRGFLAVVEEGDALASITTNHGAYVTHRYNSCYTTFNPRPKDSYNLQESISVGANAEWTVVSKRKYTGSYKIRFIQLTDKGIAEENGLKDNEYYEASYVGMAKAYREYLEKTGTLTRLTDADVKKDVPLYIESFGIIDTDDTFLSFPINVKTPLTTFEDLKTMYGELSEAGIKNINFRLTGYTNGGMVSTMPYKVKFEKNIGGNAGYADFLEYAEENDIGVYPDFDFMYSHKNKAFDGYTSRKDAVKTIDDRYTRKRTYSSSTQALNRTNLIVISPMALSKFYNKFAGVMEELGKAGLSVSTIGSDLNSDFDEDDPYNREDAKKYVTNVLEDMKNDFGSIMVDAGNAYVYKYVDHILNAPLDSSHHVHASEMVPFYGMVLHGYISFAGSPTNMAGDINYEILKMIESGASPYFTLSYENTAELKDDKNLCKYYSVSYEIWKEDLIERYLEINDALGDLQTKLITDHEFLIGERTPTALELEEDAEAEAKKAEDEAKAEAEALAKKELAENRKKYLAEEAGQVYEAPEDKEEEEEEEETEKEGYEYTKYTIDNGSIVRVTYEDGTQFILNYNSFDVTTEGYEVPAIGYLKIV